MADKDEETGLADAYALKTPDDSRRLYGGWAQTYDAGFIAEMRYAYPENLASLFLRAGGADAAPVLDVGCGTGAMGAALPGLALDGLDISPEMLAEARAKGAYRTLIEADLTRPLPLPDAAYGGVVSAGTFTHGHVGPEALDELLRAARPGAVFALGVNAGVFAPMGFDKAFARLEAAGRISAPEFPSIRVYGEDATHDHADDLALVALFRRL